MILQFIYVWAVVLHAGTVKRDYSNGITLKRNYFMKFWVTCIASLPLNFKNSSSAY